MIQHGIPTRRMSESDCRSGWQFDQVCGGRSDASRSRDSENHQAREPFRKLSILQVDLVDELVVVGEKLREDAAFVPAQRTEMNCHGAVSESRIDNFTEAAVVGAESGLGGAVCNTGVTRCVVQRYRVWDLSASRKSVWVTRLHR